MATLKMSSSQEDRSGRRQRGIEDWVGNRLRDVKHRFLRLFCCVVRWYGLALWWQAGSVFAMLH
jgi:hypothetical protein